MKQLKSFTILNTDGGDRVSYTYDVINDDTGEAESMNQKGNFFAVQTELKDLIDGIREFIRKNKLEED